MFERIDHIAVAVDNIDLAIELYQGTLGMKLTGREYLEGFGVEIATLQVGETAIELLQARHPESPIHKFIEKRGPGLHHVAFVVDDIVKALAQLKKDGLRLIDETPRPGKGNSLVAFIHPASTYSVLYELVQLGSDHPPRDR